MLIRTPDDIRPSEITAESVFRNRRQILKAAGFAGSALLLPTIGAAEDIPAQYRRLAGVRKSPLSLKEPPTPSRTSRPTTTSMSSARQGRPGAALGFVSPETVERDDLGRGGGDRHVRAGGHPEAAPRSRSASTGCAAWRPGPWSSRGWASRFGDLLKRFSPTSRAKYVAFATV